MSLAACLVMLLVFVQSIIITDYSSKDATKSSEASMSVVEKVERLTGIKLPKLADGTDLLHLIIRKCAHFYSFFVIGALSFMVAEAMGWSVRKRNLSAILGLLVASFDEIHQRFVPGRSGQIQDVCLDFAGVLFGICLVAAVWGVIFKRGAKNDEKSK